MYQSTPAAPSPRPRADPRALAFFFPRMANSRGWGLLSCQIPRGGDEKRGQMPRPPYVSIVCARKCEMVRMVRKTLVCGCQAILLRTNKWLNSVRKPTNSLAFVRRASRYIQSIQTCRTLYLSIVRCHLGYATQVWSPQSIGLLKRLENVQRRETKLILKLLFRCDVTYKTRLQLTNLLPVSLA